jgi:lipoprotein-anchoring transpeptidase ErfK/SrfK
MPLNGSGTFSRLYTWVNDRINGVKITDSRMDAEFDGIATALSSALYKDGQQTNAANQNWGGFRLTNLGDATSAADAVNRQTGDGRYYQREEAEQTVASASTIDISADGLRWSVTGTTGIATITAGNNTLKVLRFSDAVTLTHNGTSLICPGGDDLTTAAGDVVWIATDGSGNARVLQYYTAAEDPDEGAVTAAGTQTFTNKTIDSESNTLTVDLSEATVTGTTAEFNAALADGSFATLAGTETLTNKTLTSPTLTSPTLTSPIINVTSDAEGDIYYRDGSGNVARLPIGTAGQVLTVNSWGNVAPEWDPIRTKACRRGRARPAHIPPRLATAYSPTQAVAHSRLHCQHHPAAAMRLRLSFATILQQTISQLAVTVRQSKAMRRI